MWTSAAKRGYMVIPIHFINDFLEIKDKYNGYADFIIGPEDNFAKEIGKSTWHALQDFCLFLRAFKEATVLLSASDYPTLGLVLPIINLIKQHVKNSINSTENFGSIQIISFALAVQKNWMNIPSLYKKNVKLATALDPSVEITNFTKRNLCIKLCYDIHKFQRM
ncbi:hypothetical protein BB559_006080 [Furculomyces boomerangus]|uniref:Uncharacterized protein n=1 Tax=Furculomyces boomerangus TaxID=61424 RepID=A0A2T9Y4V2_9FUNG|nr:hypothetical protein BB559_006976 [Furculomyces boomerangus]PVU87361.1 hypothetical protein BB559_006080 [Furculomyces boomerangus]